MNSKAASVPKLRFPEFDADWEQKRLGDVSRFKKGKGISKNDIVEGGEIPCVRYGELYTTYGRMIEKIVSFTNVAIDELLTSDGDEILIPASGETSIDIATASVLPFDGVAIGGDLNIIITKENSFFIATYLSGKGKNHLARMAQGNSVVHLYKDQIASSIINLPSLPEQKKISAFLIAVDAKIVALRKRHAGLERYKKGLMQALFSQHLRFTKSDGTAFPDWEEKLLGDVATRSISKNTKLQYKRVLTNSAVQGVIDQDDYFDKDIANAENLAGYYVLKKGDFVYNPRISTSAPVGPIKRNDLGDGVMSPLYTVFRFNDDNTEFFTEYFATTFWHKYMKSVANYGARHDRMAITSGDLMKMPLPIPHPDEQAKIANALSFMDAKIASVGTQVDKMEAFKKGLLQQMFV